MPVSIVIVSYNTAALLERCLASIAAHAAGMEVIVVDNGSTDGSPALVREHYPAVTLIEPGENTFFSEGNNVGARAASGDRLLILNPDTELHAGALPALLGALEAHPEAGLVTARQVWTDGRTTLPICSRFNTLADLWLGATFVGALLPGWRQRRRDHMFYAGWDRLIDREVDVAPGSCMLLRGEVVAALGREALFDPAMPLYFSDDDLCCRVKAAGYSVRYVAGASITHAERASTQQVSARARAMYYADLEVYARKVFGAQAGPMIAAARLTHRLMARRPEAPRT